MSTGFIGLGVMGLPMALNLLGQDRDLLVWSRSKDKYGEISNAGGKVTSTLDEVYEGCRVILCMLANENALDQVLSRTGEDFTRKVKNHIIVNMGTVSPEYSRQLSIDIQNAGGSFVEAPVSGSRKPAEAGQLVSMISGEPQDVAEIRDLIAPIYKEAFLCGPVPNALLMKLSVNLFLITMVGGLAESFNFAKQQGVDVAQFQAVLDAGPMASSVSRMKLPKLVAEDYSVQASITDVLMNNRLITDAAESAGIASPLINVCLSLFTETQDMGLGKSDMAAVVCALEKRTQSLK